MHLPSVNQLSMPRPLRLEGTVLRLEDEGNPWNLEIEPKAKGPLYLGGPFSYLFIVL